MLLIWVHKVKMSRKTDCDQATPLKKLQINQMSKQFFDRSNIIEQNMSSFRNLTASGYY